MIRVRTRFDQICNQIRAGCLGEGRQVSEIGEARGRPSFREACLLDPGQDRLLLQSVPHLGCPSWGILAVSLPGYPEDTWILGTPSQTFPLLASPPGLSDLLQVLQNNWCPSNPLAPIWFTAPLSLLNVGPEVQETLGQDSPASGTVITCH